MPFTGIMFVRNQNFERDRDAGPPDNTISAAKVDDEFDNIAAGLTQAMAANATTRALLPTPGGSTVGQFLAVNPTGTAFWLTQLAPRGLHFFTKDTLWTVPAHVTAINVLVLGAGGYGGGNHTGTYYPRSGGGGGAGGLVIARVPVTPGQELQLLVGPAAQYSTASQIRLGNVWSIVAFAGSSADGGNPGPGGSATVSGLPDGAALRVVGSPGRPCEFFGDSSLLKINGGAGGGTLFGSNSLNAFGCGGSGSSLTKANKDAHIEVNYGEHSPGPGIIIIAY